MDRTVTTAIVVLAALVGGMFWWGWHKVVPQPAQAGVPSAPHASATPLLLYSDKPAILSESAPKIAPAADDAYWLWDGALLATRSLDDLLVYNQEDDRPPLGYPNGTTRNQSGQTPKQRELLSSGSIVLVPTAARINVVSWGSNDLVQVRVEEGAKAGTIGWINKHLLRYNHNGTFDPVYPVEIR